MLRFITSRLAVALRPECRTSSVPVLLLVMSILFSLCAQAQFALRDGDRVVFYGDEITAVQFYDNAREPRLYPTFVETFVATRFPKMKVQFVDSAWNGDRVSGGAGGPIEMRLQRDVIPYRPTVLTIMLGMNDALSAAFHPKDHEQFTTGYDMQVDRAAAVFDAQRFAAYRSGYERLVETIERALPDVRITLLTPSPYEDVAHSPDPDAFNRVLVRYGEWLDTLAQREHLTIVDANAALTAVIRSAQADNAAAAREILPDGIHPAAAGHLVIAEALLKAWNAPALVSDVEIDARGPRVVRAVNAEVRELKRDHALTWMQTDGALPFPLDLSDNAVALAVHSSDFAQQLDNQQLKVEGLGESRYEFRIDDRVVGTFDAQQLRAGINLALLDTPMRTQAKRVFALVRERENVHFGLWKRLVFPLQEISLPHKQDTVQALTTLEKELRDEQHAAAQPQAHRYELRPIEFRSAALKLP